MKKTMLVLLGCVPLLAPLLAQAQAHHGHDMQTMAQANASTAAPKSEGVVKRIDSANGTVTIAHGDLKNLGMPPMTMAFKVKDPAWLKQMKEGAKIRFTVENASGGLTVTAWEAAS